MLETDLKVVQALNLNSRRIIFFVFGAACLASIPVLRYYSDDFDVISLDQLFLSFLMVIATFFFLGLLYQRLKEGKAIRLSLFDFFSALLALYMFLSGFLHHGTSVVYARPLIYLIFYVMARCLIIDSRSAEQVNRMIYWGLVLYIFFLIFLWQQTGNLKAFIIGAFNNANENAGYLAMLIPVVIQQIKREQRRRFNSLLSISILLIILGIVISSFSRTAWLATIGMVAYFIIQTSQLRIFMKNYRILSWVIVCVGISLLAVWLYLLKPASAEGRILICKVSINMLASNPVFGIGYGRYQVEYNDFQSQYLLINPNEPRKYLADNNYTPFNEALNIGVELGVIGLVISGLLLLSFLIPAFRFSKVNCKLPVTYYMLIAVLVCSLFNYPFSSTAVNVITILAAAQLNFFFSSYSGKTFVIKWNYRTGITIFSTFMYLVMLLYGYMLVQIHQASYYWRQAMSYSLKDQREQAMAAYRKANVWLYEEGRFLYNFGAELSVWGANEESISILNRARPRYSSSSLYTYLGDGYYRTGQYQQADDAYRKAANMVPSKLYPKYKLLKLYQSTNQKKAAQEVAFEITTTPLKVPSRLASEIRAEAKKVLDSLGTGSLMR